MPGRLLGLAALATAAAIAAGGVMAPLGGIAAVRAAPAGGEDSYLRALAPARSLLGGEPIGFLGPQPIGASGGGSAELYYYLAQYALAPVLIESRPARRLVLVADPRPGRLEALLAEPGRGLVRELAPGLALVELEPRLP